VPHRWLALLGSQCNAGGADDAEYYARKRTALHETDAHHKFTELTETNTADSLGPDE